MYTLKELRKMLEDAGADAPAYTAMGGSSSTAGTGPIDTFDPILIRNLRRRNPPKK
jgi:hypothetical protein